MLFDFVQNGLGTSPPSPPHRSSLRMYLDRLLSHVEVSVEPFSLCILSGGWRLRLPEPAGPLLHFVLAGRGRLSGPGRDRHQLAPFMLAIVPGGMAHSLESGTSVKREFTFDASTAGPPVQKIVAGSADDPGLTLACGMVNVRYGRSIGLFDHLRHIIAVDLSKEPLVRAAFTTILEEQSRPAEGGGALTAGLMTASLVYFLRHLPAGNTGTLPWLLALEDVSLGRAIDSMLDDPAAPHTVELLADAAGISRSAFAKRFHAAFSRTPMAMLHGIRMEHAAKLLRDGTLTLDQIARRSGFSSRSHFSHAFKAHHGSSPRNLRNETRAVAREGGQGQGQPVKSG